MNVIENKKFKKKKIIIKYQKLIKKLQMLKLKKPIENLHYNGILIKIKKMKNKK